jgi:hypothetical protein
VPRPADWSESASPTRSRRAVVVGWTQPVDGQQRHSTPPPRPASASQQRARPAASGSLGITQRVAPGAQLLGAPGVTARRSLCAQPAASGGHQQVDQQHRGQQQRVLAQVHREGCAAAARSTS